MFNTVDSILADFRKKVDQLTKLSGARRQKAADIAIKVADLNSESDALLEEAARAEAVASKISKLIN